MTPRNLPTTSKLPNKTDMYKKTSGGGSGGSGGASSGGSSGGGGGINKRPYDTAPHPGSSGYAGPGGGTDMKRSRPDQIGGGGMYGKLPTTASINSIIAKQVFLACYDSNSRFLCPFICSFVGLTKKTKQRVARYPLKIINPNSRQVAR